MKIPEIFKERNSDGKPVFSLEVFPPRKSKNKKSIFDAVEKLKITNPDFISVTYGAGGNIADNSTCDIAAKIKHDHGIEAMAHLTCINSTREDVKVMLERYKEANLENVMALRGDIIPGEDIAGEFTHANELAIEVQRLCHDDIEIMGACYPEGHYESKSLDEDIQNLKYKIGAGVKVLISQLFFDNEKFYIFMDQVRKAGISVPISAGIMPIVKASQIENIVKLSGASFPHGLTSFIAKYENDPEALYQAGIDFAIEQCRDLIDNGVDGIHVYTMNDPKVAISVWEGIKDLL